MAFRAIVFFAFAAVAVQAAPWDFTLPGLFGSSFGLNSISARNSVGGNVKFEDGAATTTVEMGPLGGIQNKIVAPMLPSIPDIMRQANDNMNKFVNGIGNRFGRLSGLFHDTIDQQIKGFEGVLNNVFKGMGNMRTDLGELVKNSDGLMKKAIESGMINMNKIREFAAAVINSSIKNSLNAGATLIDLLEKAIKAKLMVEKQAIIIIRDAIESGLHMAEGGVHDAVNKFLDTAEAAGKISKDLADKLKEQLREAGNKAQINTEATINNGANAGANGNAGANTNAAAAANTEANKEAAAAGTAGVDANAAAAAQAQGATGAAVDTTGTAAAPAVNVNVNA